MEWTVWERRGMERPTRSRPQQVASNKTHGYVYPRRSYNVAISRVTRTSDNIYYVNFHCRSLIPEVVGRAL